MHRNTRLRSSLLLAAVALTACEQSSVATPSPAETTAVIAEGVGNASNIKKISIYVGQTADASVNNSRRARLATWRSSNEGVAQVTPTGVVTGVDVGEATVSSSDGTQSLVWVLPAPTVSSFSIAPKQGADLPTGGVRQFSATAVWSDGAPRSVGVTYQASAGTISNGGLFTAGTQAGNVRVIATCDCGKADTAIVVVASAVQLAALRISPKAVTIVPGALQQFSASANWSTGATDLPPLAYSASAPGAVSPTGEYRAPTSVGTYYVYVAHVGGTLRDTAVVTVLAPGGDPTTPPPTTPPPTTTPPPSTTPPPTTTPPTTPPPVTPPPTNPPVVPDNFTPNLPTDKNLRFVTDSRLQFAGEGIENSDQLTMAWAGRNAVDASAPYGSNVFETYYPGNDAGNGVGGAIIRTRISQKWRRLYFSMMMFIPNDYVMHSNGEKFFYPIIANAAGYAGGAPINMYPMNYSPAGPEVGFIIYPGHGELHAVNSPSVTLKKGKWTFVEMYVEINTPGNADGVWKLWIDGQHAVTRTDMKYTTSTLAAYFDCIKFDGTRGGGASTVLTPPGGQVRRYNRLVAYASE